MRCFCLSELLSYASVHRPEMLKGCNVVRYSSVLLLSIGVDNAPMQCVASAYNYPSSLEYREQTRMSYYSACY